MTDPAQLAATKTAAVTLWIGLILVAERLAPAAKRRGGWPRVGRNAGLFAVNIALSAIAVIPITAFAASIAPAWRPGWMDGGWALLGDLVVLDLWIYFWHRTNHAVPALWRFHEIHHLDEFLDASSAVRFHGGEVLLSAGVRAAVIVALDIPLASVLVFETLVLVAAVFQHSNLRLPARLERILARVVVTPSIHWVHHHVVPRDTDSNYGTVLSLWDRLFATLSPTPRTPTMRIGLDSARDVGMLALILRPFRRPERGRERG